jgi:SAM-dependent methyltransferase
MAETKIVFDASDDYERFMGRWSRAIGEQFLAWLDPPKDAQWLDLGCGTGAFSELILHRCAPKSVTGLDPAPAQIDYVRKLLPGHTFEVGDSMAMPFGDGAFDIVASALVFHFIPDRTKAFAEMHRVLRPGGLVAGYTWKRTSNEDFAPYAAMMAGVKHIGGELLMSPLVAEGSDEGMRASLGTAGFTDIATREIEVMRTFRDFDDYWDVQCIPFSPPGRTIAKLDDAQRAKLRDVMRERMTPGADGSITYAATAMAGRGRKP